jgi:hypothetical protein
MNPVRFIGEATVIATGAGVAVGLRTRLMSLVRVLCGDNENAPPLNRQHAFHNSTDR